MPATTAATLARQRLIALLEGITPAAGYHHDLSASVYAGAAIVRVRPDTPRPVLAIASTADTEAATSTSSHQCTRRMQIDVLLDAVRPADPEYDYEAAADLLLHDLHRAIAQRGVARSADRVPVKRDGDVTWTPPEAGSEVCTLTVPITLTYFERLD